MASGEQISFQPTFTLVFAKHRVQNTSFGSQEFIIFNCPGIPLTISFFKYSTQKIRDSLIGAKNPEISLILIEFFHVAEELTQYHSILTVNSTGRRYFH